MWSSTWRSKTKESIPFLYPLYNCIRIPSILSYFFVSFFVEAQFLFFEYICYLVISSFPFPGISLLFGNFIFFNQFFFLSFSIQSLLVFPSSTLTVVFQSFFFDVLLSYFISSFKTLILLIYFIPSACIVFFCVFVNTQLSLPKVSTRIWFSIRFSVNKLNICWNKIWFYYFPYK